MSDDDDKDKDGNDDKKIEPLKPLPFKRPAVKVKPENGAPLPSPGDPYQAAGFVAESDLARLVLVMGREGFKDGETAYVILQYVHIGLGEFGFEDDGQFFRFVFSDIQPKLIEVHGRSLLRICDQIALRRMPWIRQADRDFRLVAGGANDEPIITKINIDDWKPRED